MWDGIIGALVVGYSLAPCRRVACHFELGTPTELCSLSIAHAVYLVNCHPRCVPLQAASTLPSPLHSHDRDGHKSNKSSCKLEWFFGLFGCITMCVRKGEGSEGE